MYIYSRSLSHTVPPPFVLRPHNVRTLHAQSNLEFACTCAADVCHKPLSMRPTRGARHRTLQHGFTVLHSAHVLHRTLQHGFTVLHSASALHGTLQHGFTVLHSAHALHGTL